MTILKLLASLFVIAVVASFLHLSTAFGATTVKIQDSLYSTQGAKQKRSWTDSTAKSNLLLSRLLLDTVTNNSTDNGDTVQGVATIDSSGFSALTFRADGEVGGVNFGFQDLDLGDAAFNVYGDSGKLVYSYGSYQSIGFGVNLLPVYELGVGTNTPFPGISGAMFLYDSVSKMTGEYVGNHLNWNPFFEFGAGEFCS